MRMGCFRVVASCRYSNVILIPRQAIQTVLLLNKTVTAEQRSVAVHMVERGATTFGRFVYGLGYITGANTLDISSNLVNAGIVQALAGNSTGYDLIAGAFQRVHNEVVVQTAVKSDGIRPDGSFGQHVGILYNGMHPSIGFLEKGFADHCAGLSFFPLSYRQLRQRLVSFLLPSPGNA